MDFDHNIESITPGSDLTIPSTGFLTLPKGTTAERPSSPVNGMLRYNTSEDVLDGQIAPYNLSQAPYALQKTLSYRKRKYLIDEFLTGATTINTIGLIGELGWSNTNGNTSTISYQTAIVDHPGIIRLATASAVSGSSACLHLGTTPSSSIIMSNQVEYFSFLVRFPSVTTIDALVGLGNDVNSAVYGTEGVAFVLNTDTTTAIQFYTRAGNVVSAGIPTVTAVANTWYLLEAFYDGIEWTPVVNGIAYSPQTTLIPSAAVNVGMFIEPLAAFTSRSIDIDGFWMITRETGNRY